MTASFVRRVDDISQAPPRRATLDGLRGCAVLLILAHHFVSLHPAVSHAALGSNLAYLHAILGLTFTGVDLFFVLSGFLIGGILLDYRDSPHLLPAFFIRRAVRILPLAWLSIGIIFALHAAGQIATNEPRPDSWIYFCFVSNFDMARHGAWTFGPLVPHWSLSIEEQFYIVFPFVVRLCSRERALWLGPILMVAALVIRLGMYWRAPEEMFAAHVLPFCRMDSLGAGFTCACLVRTSWWSEIRVRRQWLWGALALSAVGVATLLKLHAGEGHPALATWGYTALAVFYAALLLLAYDEPESWLRRSLSARWLTIYGRYSYFIYLFQGLLAGGLVSLLFHGRWQTDNPMTWWETAAAPLVILVPAILSWRVLESPFMKFGHRWSYR